MYKTIFVGLLVTFLLLSCRHPTEKSGSYFDSLVTAQVRCLSAAGAGITKVARIDGKDDQSRFIPNVIVWDNELDAFRQLSSFEKPANRIAYTLQDRVHDSNSNLLIRSYKTSAKIPVRELKFYYLGQFKNLKKIEAIYYEENALYSSKRFLFMEFDEVHGQPWLSKYGMDGVQKMVLSDSLRFSITSSVKFLVVH